MARPKLDFNWELVESLAILEASEQFIAERLLIAEKKDVTKHTIAAKIKLIQRRVKERFGCSYVQFREQKVECRKVKLREWQWKNAEKGNAVMQIWLGKNYLSQKDRSAQELSGPEGRPIETRDATALSDAELDAKLKALMAKSQVPG